MSKFPVGVCRSKVKILTFTKDDVCAEEKEASVKEQSSFEEFATLDHLEEKVEGAGASEKDENSFEEFEEFKNLQDDTEPPQVVDATKDEFSSVVKPEELKEDVDEFDSFEGGWIGKPEGANSNAKDVDSFEDGLETPKEVGEDKQDVREVGTFEDEPVPQKNREVQEADHDSFEEFETVTSPVDAKIEVPESTSDLPPTEANPTEKVDSIEDEYVSQQEKFTGNDFLHVIDPEEPKPEEPTPECVEDIDEFDTVEGVTPNVQEMKPDESADDSFEDGAETERNLDNSGDESSSSVIKPEDPEGLNDEFDHFERKQESDTTNTVLQGEEKEDSKKFKFGDESEEDDDFGSRPNLDASPVNAGVSRKTNIFSDSDEDEAPVVATKPRITEPPKSTKFSSEQTKPKEVEAKSDSSEPSGDELDANPQPHDVHKDITEEVEHKSYYDDSDDEFGKPSEQPEFDSEVRPGYSAPASNYFDDSDDEFKSTQAPTSSDIKPDVQENGEYNATTKKSAEPIFFTDSEDESAQPVAADDFGDDFENPNVVVKPAADDDFGDDFGDDFENPNVVKPAADDDFDDWDFDTPSAPVSISANASTTATTGTTNAGAADDWDDFDFEQDHAEDTVTAETKDAEWDDFDEFEVEIFFAVSHAL